MRHGWRTARFFILTILLTMIEWQNITASIIVRSLASSQWDR